MASRRMIDPAFWQSETVAALPIAARYFFIGLFSNADDQGRMKAHPALIRSKLYPYDDISLDEIREWLERLALDDFVILYENGERDYLQITNWWTYQRPRWAWPSKHPAPQDWQDRVCYRQGNNVVKQNWDSTDATTTPDLSDDDSTLAPQRPHSGPTLAPAPSGSISGSTSGRGSEEIAADAAPPSPPESKTEKPKRKPRQPKDPPPPAVARYRSVTNLYPEKSLWPGIAEVIGEHPDDLDRWERVVKGWCAMGWNKRNVKTQLEYFRDGRQPGDDNGRDARAGPKPKQFAHLEADVLRQHLREDIDKYGFEH